MPWTQNLTSWARVRFTTVFDWSNTQNGKLIGSIGIVSAVIQGGYVRRALTRVGELKMARRGMCSCAIALVALSLLPQFTLSQPRLAFRLLQIAAIGMAFTSATVVNALTAHASLQCDEAPEPEVTSNGHTPRAAAVQRPELAKGQALGRFRSSGQLGRAIGPLFGKYAYIVWQCFCTVVLTVVCSFSMCVLLDFRALYHIRGRCGRYGWTRRPYAEGCT